MGSIQTSVGRAWHHLASGKLSSEAITQDLWGIDGAERRAEKQQDGVKAFMTPNQEAARGAGGGMM